MRIMVITPTTGKDTLKRAIDSVIDQTVKVDHLLVADGLEAAKTNPHFYSTGHRLTLQENIGGDGWYGHRIYAAVPLLVNADFILFLDEDNWFEPEHVETMVNTIERNNLSWAYSLRRLYNESGEYQFDDDCESLGKYPAFYDPNLNFVDTNCYCFRRDYLIHVAHHFYNQWGADRGFYKAASTVLPDFNCTGKATVNYVFPQRLQRMFEEGNQLMQAKYNGKLPWRENGF